MGWFDSLFVLPYSMLVVFLVNICVVLISASIFRIIVDVKRLEAREFEVLMHGRSLRETKEKNDKVALRKLKRGEVWIKRLSASVSKPRLKVIIITILPFTTVSLLLNTFYAGNQIALFPFELDFFKKYSFSTWYFITYLAASLPLSKIFGTAPNFWQISEAKSN